MVMMFSRRVVGSDVVLRGCAAPPVTVVGIIKSMQQGATIGNCGAHMRWGFNTCGHCNHERSHIFLHMCTLQYHGRMQLKLVQRAVR